MKQQSKIQKLGFFKWNGISISLFSFSLKSLIFSLFRGGGVKKRDPNRRYFFKFSLNTSFLFVFFKVFHKAFRFKRDSQFNPNPTEPQDVFKLMKETYAHSFYLPQSVTSCNFNPPAGEPKSGSAWRNYSSCLGVSEGVHCRQRGNPSVTEYSMHHCIWLGPNTVGARQQNAPNGIAQCVGGYSWRGINSYGSRIRSYLQACSN